MGYQHLDLHFKALWGKPFQGERSPLAQKDLDWRAKMAKRPIEERYAMSDKEYSRLELIEHNKNKEMLGLD